VWALGETLRQRLGRRSHHAAGTVMAEIDVAISRSTIYAASPESSRRALLAQTSERLLGRSAEELGLQECLRRQRAHTASGLSGVGRWGGAAPASTDCRTTCWS
jgi:hypothetical protein